MLGRNITEEEIKKVVYDMCSLKALRDDGFQALLYQSQ